MNKPSLHTQFCIGVELGDDSLVRYLVVKGADTMVSYAVDGVITTPMQSALKRGDVAMAQALLTSKYTRVKLTDLDSAPRVKSDLVTAVALRRISNALEDGAREMIMKRELPRQIGGQKVSLSDSVHRYLKSPSQVEEFPGDAQSTKRCPPPQLDDEMSSTSGEEDPASSISSSAGDDSYRGEDEY